MQYIDSSSSFHKSIHSLLYRFCKSCSVQFICAKPCNTVIMYRSCRITDTAFMSSHVHCIIIPSSIKEMLNAHKFLFYGVQDQF